MLVRGQRNEEMEMIVDQVPPAESNADLRVETREITEWRSVSSAPFMVIVLIAAFFAPRIMGAGDNALIVGVGLVVGLSVLWAFGGRWLIRNYIFESKGHGLREEVRKGLIEFAGAELLFLDVSTATHPSRSEIAGSAIAWDGTSLYVVDGGLAGKIPWGLVREWSWRVEGVQKLSTVNNSTFEQQRRMAEVNQDRASAAYRGSGMFIEVADLEKSSWHFQSANAEVLKRWNEIMTQIGEGRSPRPTERSGSKGQVTYQANARTHSGARLRNR